MAKFTEDKVKMIREDISTALKAVGEKYGISVQIGAISYSTAQFTCKISASATEKPEIVAGASLIGRRFKSGGNNIYTIVGMPNSDTVELRTQRGTKYRGTVASLDNVVWVG